MSIEHIHDRERIEILESAGKPVTLVRNQGDAPVHSFIHVLRASISRNHNRKRKRTAQKLSMIIVKGVGVVKDAKNHESMRHRTAAMVEITPTMTKKSSQCFLVSGASPIALVPLLLPFAPAPDRAVVVALNSLVSLPVSLPESPQHLVCQEQ